MVTSFYKAYDQQYKVVRDDKKTWRILDLRNSVIQNLGPDEEVPDDSPALKIITEGEFLALIQAAIENGVIENASVSGENADSKPVKDTEAILNKALEEKKELEIRLGYIEQALEEEKKIPKIQHSEGYMIKSKALDAIKSLALAEDIQKMV